MQAARSKAVTTLFLFGMLSTGWLGDLAGPATSRAATPCTSPTGQTVSVLIKNPDGTQLLIPNVPWIENCNVHLAMLNAEQIDPHLAFSTSYFCPYGSFANSIDGFQESGAHFWALYVNGVFAQHGMDTQLLNPNDKVTWQVDTTTAIPSHRRESTQAKMIHGRLARRVDFVLENANKK